MGRKKTSYEGCYSVSMKDAMELWDFDGDVLCDFGDLGEQCVVRGKC